jgi:FKBP-type peptidyl-prolyl cis-trans isomerase
MSAGTGGDPLAFRLGDGQVIVGWDQGIRDAVGDRRQLIVPTDLLTETAASDG